MKFDRYELKYDYTKNTVKAYYAPDYVESALQLDRRLIIIVELSNEKFILQTLPLLGGKIISEHNSLTAAVVAYRILQSQGPLES
jgi:hypothetical protein